MTTPDEVAVDPQTFAKDLVESIEPYRQQIFSSRFVAEMKRGTLPLRVIREWVSQQFAYVLQFPTWHGMVLRKVEDRPSREVLSENIQEELDHPEMWLKLAAGFGMSEDEVRATELCPEMQALNDFLTLTCLEDEPAASMAALGVSLEGLSDRLVQEVMPGLGQHYHGRDGVRLDRDSLVWLTTHQGADPKHSTAAIDVVSRYATTAAIQRRTKFVARRALEFFLGGFDGCCRRYAG